MAVISVTASDDGEIVPAQHWQVPAQAALNASPIPRGLRKYQNGKPIAALGAGDETDFLLKFTFPIGFVYLPKSITVSFVSDDITSEFGNIGILEYRPAAATGIGSVRDYEMVSAGQSIRLALRSIQTYIPQGTWRQWIIGNDLDQLIVNLQDMSGDTSTAGDMEWYAEFWEFDVEQCLKWPVNTALQVLQY